MPVPQVGADWSVEWAAASPDGEIYCDCLMLDRDQASEFGDELVKSLRVDGKMMRERGLDPDEPFAWKIENGELLTKQISRRTFEMVAESDRDDAHYAQNALEFQASQRRKRYRREL